MKAIITLEDTEAGDVAVSCEFSEPLTDKTQSEAVLLAREILLCVLDVSSNTEDSIAPDEELSDA